MVKLADKRSDFQRCKDFAKKNGLIVEKIRKGRYTVTWNHPHGEITAECSTIDELTDEIHDLSTQKQEFEAEMKYFSKFKLS